MNRNLDHLDPRITYAVEQAQLAFWQVIAEQFPEVKTGDYSPHDTIELDNWLKIAVDRWIDANYPNKQQAIISKIERLLKSGYGDLMAEDKTSIPAEVLNLVQLIPYYDGEVPENEVDDLLPEIEDAEYTKVQKEVDEDNARMAD
jgi:hypothetical protein